MNNSSDNNQNQQNGLIIFLSTEHKKMLLTMFDLAVEHNISSEKTKHLEKQLSENNDTLDFFMCESLKERLTHQINHFKTFHIKKISNTKAKLSKSWFPSTKKSLLAEIKRFENLYNMFVELESALKL